ncbi:MAG: chemotaxis protein CheD, partial [Ferruginibacter sp.]
KVFCSKKPHMVHTILGSCVAVSLWDQVLHFGSINHYMLPDKEGSTSFKYGNIAIAELIKRMVGMGSVKSNIKAKIFGGSEISNSNGIFNIGKRNIFLAQEMLKLEQIPIVSFSVGGPVGRKVIFNSATGEVLINYIKHKVNFADQKKVDNKFNLLAK